MKQAIRAFAAKNNVTAKYSGKDKTMYLSGPGADKLVFKARLAGLKGKIAAS